MRSLFQMLFLVVPLASALGDDLHSCKFFIQISQLKLKEMSKLSQAHLPYAGMKGYDRVLRHQLIYDADATENYFDDKTHSWDVRVSLSQPREALNGLRYKIASARIDSQAAAAAHLVSSEPLSRASIGENIDWNGMLPQPRVTEWQGFHARDFDQDMQYRGKPRPITQMNHDSLAAYYVRGDKSLWGIPLIVESAGNIDVTLGLEEKITYGTNYLRLDYQDGWFGFDTNITKDNFRQAPIRRSNNLRTDNKANRKQALTLSLTEKQLQWRSTQWDGVTTATYTVDHGYAEAEVRFIRSCHGMGQMVPLMTAAE